MNLSDIHGYPQLYDGLFGIEVECEGDHLPKDGMFKKKWDVTRDGSLRGDAYEYILKKPLALDEAIAALEELNEAMANSVLHFSFRTSVHVHVNCQNITKEQLDKFIYCSFLLEDLLVEFSGDYRIGNRFCLRLRDAEYGIEAIESITKNGDRIRQLNNDTFKYMAINLVPLYGRGSVEFRSMEGTLDLQVLETWLNILSKIHTFAANTKLSVKEIEELAYKSPDKFINEVLDIFSNHLKFEGFEWAIRESVSRLIEISNLNFKYENQKKLTQLLKVYDCFEGVCFAVKTGQIKTNSIYRASREEVVNRVILAKNLIKSFRVQAGDVIVISDRGDFFECSVVLADNENNRDILVSVAGGYDIVLPNELKFNMSEEEEIRQKQKRGLGRGIVPPIPIPRPFYEAARINAMMEEMLNINVNGDR